jgi:hypothetical protein
VLIRQLITATEPLHSQPLARLDGGQFLAIMRAHWG